MRTTALLAAVTTLCLFASCGKDYKSGIDNGTGKPQTYIEETHVGSFNQTDTFNLSYDASGRLINMVSTKGKITYTYGANNTFSMELYQSGMLIIHENVFVNSTLQIDSTFQYNNVHDTTTEKYLYNGLLLASKLTYDYASQGPVLSTRNTYTSDNNGNILKDVEADGGGNVNTTTTYTYTDKPVQFSINTTLSLLPSKNLPAMMTVVDGGGVPLNSVTYSYTFDNSGRLTKETDAIDNVGTVTKTYLY